MKKLLFIATYLIANFSLFGTNPQLPLRFEQISIQHGLSQSVVSSILQDRHGFIWFGTQDGLNKYDGYSFTVYRNIPFDDKSLSFSEITCLFEDSRGDLWIGTVRGLNRFLPSENTFERYFHLFNNTKFGGEANIRGITEDEFGNIVVGTASGVKVLVPSPISTGTYYNAKTYYTEKLASGAIAGNMIRCVFKDKSSNIWVITEKGLNKLINHSTHKYDVNYSFENVNNSTKKIYSFATWKIDSDNLGNIWLSDGTSLYVLNGKTHELIPPKFIQAKKDSLNIPKISAIHCVNDEVWVYSYTDGLIKIKTNGRNIIEFIERFNQNPPQSKFNQMVGILYSFPSNKENMLWIGTEGAGAYKVYLKGNFFAKYNMEDKLPSNFVTSAVKDHKGYVWVGTHNGVVRMDRKSRSLKVYNVEQKLISSNFIAKIFQDKRRNIWAGSQQGLNLYDSTKDKFEPIYFGQSYKPFSNIRSTKNFCGDIFEDSKENIWFGAADGVKKFNSRDNVFKFYNYNTADLNSFLPGYVYAIAEDSDSTIWFGTNFGLCKYNQETDDFSRFSHDPADRKSIPANVVLSLTKTSSGDLWMGTAQGIAKLSYNDNKLISQAFTTEDGLPNNFAYGILEDEKGNLWISTNSGISKFDPKKKSFRNYQEKDGLQSLEFNSFAYHKAADGEMFFGGILGLNSFYPKEEPINTFLPPVHISKIYLHGKPLNLDSLTKTGNSISLSHNQNYLLFEFSALSYKHPEANQYAYKMEGLDDTWFDLKTRRIASFNNLAPGEYIFRLKASNDDGIWNNRGTSFSIKINPPFYLTIWFYLIIASLVVVLIIVTHNYIVKRRVHQLMVLQKIRNEEQEKIRKKTAEDFHDELGNKLTRISILAELAKAKGIGQSEEVSQIISKISDNANTLFYGTKDLIWSINPQNDSFYELAIRLKDFGDELFDNTEIRFDISGISDALKNIVLPMDTGRHIVLIFKEAMTNALKHADCRNVILSFDLEDNVLLIKLTDDGKGFGTAPAKSDGNGLCNMKSRAKKINSELIIDTIKGKGTSIKLLCSVEENILHKHLSN